MVHQRNWIIVAVVVFSLIAFIPFAQAEPPHKEGNPGLPGCLAKVDQLEQIIADQNLTILGLQEQIDKLTTLLKALEKYAPVAKTGQTKCYDPFSESEIPCTNTGQDGDLQKGVTWPVPRFTNNNNGTVTDELTGLIWTKNADRWGTSHWDVALSLCNHLAADGTSLTDGSKAGDWRLPNVNEMLSLIDYGIPNSRMPEFPEFRGHHTLFVIQKLAQPNSDLHNPRRKQK
jgi:hypothetical protein